MDIIDDLLEIKLGQPDDFLKIRETLTRIGVASKKDNTLFQSCHILHKRGKYYIVHFKELFKLDGKPSSLDESDIGRRNSIACILEEWGLCTIVEPTKAANPKVSISQIKIISYRDKQNWKLEAKYTIGRKRY
jgi:hypothetical protein